MESETMRLLKFVLVTLLLAAYLAIVSGHPDWLRAWCFILLVQCLQTATTMLLAHFTPDLLVERSRMQKGTKRWDRILAPIVAGVGPLVMFTVAALDVRYHWPPPVPISYSLAAFTLCTLGCVFTAWAMLSNPFFSATVRLQTDRGHVVATSGPYRYVRHPGYSGAALFTAAAPLALGSWLALIPALAILAALVLRTALEDRMLHSELAGYPEYAKQVRSRLVPGLW